MGWSSVLLSFFHFCSNSHVPVLWLASLHLVTSSVNHTPDSSCPRLLHTHTSRPTMWRQDSMGVSAEWGLWHCYCCLVAKSCLTLCNSMDYNLPGSSVHGILWTRILEWVAIFFFRWSSPSRDWTHISCIARWILYHWATRKAPSVAYQVLLGEGEYLPNKWCCL